MNVFGCNLTNGENSSIDGYCFIARSAPDEMRDKMFADINKFEVHVHKRDMPTWLVVLWIVNMIIGFSLIVAIVNIIFNGNLGSAFENVPWLFPLAAVSVSVHIYIEWCKSKADRETVCDENYKQSLSDVYSTQDKCFRYLNVPVDSPEIDVLRFNYKNNKVQPYSMTPYYEYCNCSVKVFVEDNCLCFCQVPWVIKIPISSITGITKMKGRASCNAWNKNVSFSDKLYKSYKVFYNWKFGTYLVYYYNVHIKDEKGEFDMFIPNYDIDIIARLTGLSVN